MRGTLILYAALATQSAAAVADDEKPPFVLQPSSDWLMDYAEDSCRLARSFGVGDDRVILALEQSSPTDLFKVTLLGPTAELDRAGRLTFRTLPEGNSSDHPLYSAKLADGSNALVLYRVPLTTNGAPVRGHAPAIDLVRAATVRSVEFVRSARALSLQTGPLDGAMKAMTSCVDDLLRASGIDPAIRDNFASPRGDPSTWVTHQDYPSSMLRENKEGAVWMVVEVGNDGKPTKCRVGKSTLPGSFGELVCRLIIRRARFEPMIDAEGRPVTGSWSTRVHFSIPK